MNSILKYFIGFLIFTFTACEKENADELSANFSCTINGEQFYPEKLSKSLFRINISENLELGIYSFDVYALNDNDRYKRIQFSMDVSSPITEGEYEFYQPLFSDNGLDFLFGNWYFEKTGSSSIETPQESSYWTSEKLKGQLTIIEINRVNERIKAEFHFQAINDNTGEIINVENGKFDTKLYIED